MSPFAYSNCGYHSSLGEFPTLSTVTVSRPVCVKPTRATRRVLLRRRRSLECASPVCKVATLDAQAPPQSEDVEMEIVKVVESEVAAGSASKSDAEMTPSTEASTDDIDSKASSVQEDDASEAPVLPTSEQFVHALGVVLTQWVQEVADVPGAPHKVGVFHSVRAPPMSISDYLDRLRKYFGCSDECFVLALVYIDRASQKHPEMKVCDVTAHRLLMIASMIAAKFHDDQYYSNAYYAKAGGLKMKEVNGLELKMLKALEWKTFVSPQEYQLYHNLLVEKTGC